MKLRIITIITAALATLAASMTTAQAAAVMPRSDYGCNTFYPWDGPDNIPLCIRVDGNGNFVSWIQVGISIWPSGETIETTESGRFLVHTTFPARDGLDFWSPTAFTCRSWLGIGVCWYWEKFQVNRDIGLDQQGRGEYPDSHYGENDICVDLYTYPGYKHEGGPACVLVSG